MKSYNGSTEIIFFDYIRPTVRVSLDINRWSLARGLSEQLPQAKKWVEIILEFVTQSLEGSTIMKKINLTHENFHIQI